MPLSADDLVQILQAGRESLNIEFKPWFPLSEDSGKAILAKASMAIRNADGGCLVIGMNDDGTTDNRDYVSDPRSVFHHDSVQEIISRYSSDFFEITVHFVSFDGMDRVIVEIPPGVRTPAICRNNLPRNASGGYEAGSRLKEGELYVRTLAANGRPSSSPAKLVDWPRIMETCFNNREADIGAFMRRQLSGLDLTNASAALFDVLKVVKSPAANEVADAFLDFCFERFVDQRSRLPEPVPTTGLREMSAVITGGFSPPELSRDYLRQFGGMRRYTGWPPFVSMLNPDSDHAKLGYDGLGVESLRHVINYGKSLDYSRIESSGKFYYLEALRDDMTAKIDPLEQLEFVIETARVTEVIAVVLTFAKVFCGNESRNELVFGWRWRGLLGRYLTSWEHPRRGFAEQQPATTDTLVTHATIPVSIATDAIGLHVESIVKPLFRLFGGRQFDSQVIQEIVSDTLDRRL